MLMTALILVTAQAAPAATVTAPAEDKVVCRYEESVSTRIRGKKVCMKQSEWAAIEKANQDDLHRSSGRRLNPGNTPGQ